ncbi:unnamed protein product [Closterium sp. Naga37s-1]|nr:unnamed protein product [Closterium sp. Naga37s-1]
MRIVSFNVNGLRARVQQHGSLGALLSALDADVVCLQETKLARQDVTEDVAITPGYEAFFSFNRAPSRGRLAYSGLFPLLLFSSSRLPALQPLPQHPVVLSTCVHAGVLCLKEGRAPLKQQGEW